MANVLPLGSQKQVARAYGARLMLALALAITTLALVLALSLVPSYLALSLATTPERESSANRVAAADARMMADAQAVIAQLHTALSSTSSPSRVVALATTARPEGVRVDRMTYTAPHGDKPAAIQIVGNASREKIAAYRDALVANPSFANVAVPVAALIGNPSGDFSITLTVRDMRSAF